MNGILLTGKGAGSKRITEKFQKIVEQKKDELQGIRQIKKS